MILSLGTGRQLGILKNQRINQDQSWNAAPHLDGHSIAAKHAEIQFAFSQRML